MSVSLMGTITTQLIRIVRATVLIAEVLAARA